jgi:hypothetical protein
MTTMINPVVVQAVMTAAASLGLIAVVFLLSLLVQRELLNGTRDVRARRFAESLLIVIVPLLVVFGVIVTFRAMDAWQ